ncbi:hypothetical protein [Pontivivens ytuae]|uniref:Uncharacterized protein n=1 Tax=Pontivivens ytuae TaxID=2789856 RepID=A0A7S9QC07_9RHOB|nr:hypothetical protein [Pontivivens ytuae]QPH52581.1 hypothetical protein I0K15_12225 [Pontivivens ytuae]
MPEVLIFVVFGVLLSVAIRFSYRLGKYLSPRRSYGRTDNLPPYAGDLRGRDDGGGGFDGGGSD